MKSLFSPLSLLLCTLVLASCGGKSTPSLWEQQFEDESARIQKLVRTHEGTTARFNYQYGVASVAVVNDAGDIVNTYQFGEESLNPLNLDTVTDGYLWYATTTPINVIKLNSSFAVEWQYRGEPGEESAKAKAFDSDAASSTMMYSATDAGGNFISKLNASGEEISRFSSTAPEIIGFSNLLHDSEGIIYAFAETAAKTADVYIFNASLQLQSIIPALNYTHAQPLQHGFVIFYDDELQAYDNIGQLAWQRSIETNLNIKKFVVADDIIYIAGDHFFGDDDSFIIGDTLLETYSAEGNLLWSYKHTRTGLRYDIKSINIHPLSNGGVVLSSEQKSGVLRANLDVRITGTIKHRVFSEAGALIRTISEPSYQYDDVFCILCYDQKFVTRGNIRPKNVVEISNGQLVTLSESYESDNSAVSIMSAY